MSALQIPLLIMSTVMKVAGGVQQAQSIRQATNYNAKILKQQSDLLNLQAQSEKFQGDMAISQEKMQGDKAVSDLLKSKRLTSGEQVMRYLASGVKLEGSPLLVMESTKAQYDLDIATQRYNTATGIATIKYNTATNVENTLRSSKSLLKDREQTIKEGGQKVVAEKIGAIGSLLAGTYGIGKQQGWWTK